MSNRGAARSCTFRNASVLFGNSHTIERPLEAIASEAVAGSSYKLQITPATTLYTPQRSAGTVTFARIEVSLPIVG